MGPRSVSVYSGRICSAKGRNRSLKPEAIAGEVDLLQLYDDSITFLLTRVLSEAPQGVTVGKFCRRLHTIGALAEVTPDLFGFSPETILCPLPDAAPRGT